ncbi:hypothetical protein BX616_003210 [Lobosporangium transversale]|uniref:VLRF1 domain-containing protein n=1 Tax=Lobosporangium transversale TaxID=64571 RepID=A0A1Y2H178_9FUNG|nr:hypothetical protein BCR41DRAFT_383511 [Lobosporangium transversale]KAF9916637.1 hypothetical protein BX616_003210 [Lobosporangium transversale]ORZ27794.1 hypothetical protein BCR41DRAFT_383511 [Lobosporangium transversale]|eukprot:XP_021885497.1 hypothetical protein BCR41DRAFT_383511 [Lobosporangium transversale]
MSQHKIHSTTEHDHAVSPTAKLAMPSAPLSIFFLPPEIISSLSLNSQSEILKSDPLLENHTINTAVNQTYGSDTVATPVPTSLDSAAPSCRICGITQFESVEKQREHVKLDWHRYNLKQQLLNKQAKPISEAQFENMIQDLSSISGSDTDDSDYYSDLNNDGATGRISSLMKKIELSVKEGQEAREQDPLMIYQRQRADQQFRESCSSPLIWFTSSLYNDTVRLGIYKNALPNKGQCENIVAYLQSLQFDIPPPVNKKKNNKARREARRLAAAAVTAEDPKEALPAIDEQIDQSAGTPLVDSIETVAAQQDSQAQNNVQNLGMNMGERGQEDGQEEEEEEEVEYEPDWIKYQKQAKQKQNASANPPHQARLWTLIMIGGGHFAGMVMDLAGQVSSHGRDMKVIAHKTFHRYTVRRQQGGSQGSHGIANSAGARVRMYNEEALKLEVRELLEGWSHWIQQSECVFVHSPGNNRRVLFFENSVISTADRQGRLRSIPFMTRRPTLSELKRAYLELTTVKVSVLSPEALKQKELEEQEALERALRNSQARATSLLEGGKKAKQPTMTTSSPSPELIKLVELVKKGRAEAMSNHIQKYGIDVSQPLPLTTSTEYDIRRTPTILHVASHHGQAQVVKALLEKHMADPTITSTISGHDNDSGQDDSENKSLSLGTSSLTAYDVAKDKETRNAFRRAMALLPEAWDWVGQAHVPSALTPEMEAEQERKAKEKARKVLEAERERKKTKEPSRSKIPVEHNSASRLTVTSSTSPPSLLAKNMASVSAAHSNLSPEMRMRLERERRANAAEARMAAMRQAETIRRAVQEGKNICVTCGKSLNDLTPFDKFGRKFCTTECVAKGPA